MCWMYIVHDMYRKGLGQLTDFNHTSPDGGESPSQGSGDVSNRSEIQMNIWYHGRVATYSEYQKTTIRKYLTEGYVQK